MITQKSFFEQNGGTYTQAVMYFFPTLPLERQSRSPSASTAGCASAI